MNNTLLKRSITGLVFVLILISGILISRYTFMGLFLVITILSMHELYELSLKDDIQPLKYYGISVGVLFFLANFFLAYGFIPVKLFLLFIPLIITIPVIELYRRNQRPFINIAFTVFGLLYVALPFSLLNHIVHLPAVTGQEFSPNILLGLFFLLWANDTGAYLVGSKIGRRRLFQRISPKKSWEGSIGGAISALLIAVLLAYIFPELTIINWLIVGGIVVAMGTYGDLIESLFKRSINVKDSGKILPGHGGMLDRFDSIIISAPIVFVYLQFLEPMF